jgi:signal transduction histidine kinase
MNAAAGRLTQSVVGAVILAGLTTGAALALASPRFLLIDPELGQRTLERGVIVGAIELVLLCGIAWLRLYRHRFTLRALGLGSHTVEPDALMALGKEPGAITIRGILLTVAGALLTLLPPVRPEGLELDIAVSIILLALSFSTTAGLALYVFLRRRVSQALLLAPEDAMREVMERVLASGTAEVWTMRRVLAAVLTPTAFVGVSAALIVHAHVRSFEASGRLATATAIAQAALEPIPGPVPTAGEEDAALAGGELGYSIRLYDGSTPFQVRRFSTGQVVVAVPLDLGHATVSFPGTTVVTLTASSILAAILASLLAAVVGIRIGRALAADLEQAGTQVRMLGTDTVLRGFTRVARPARFAAVAQLGGAIEKLADRFRVFASAQEKAIAARQAARRMRGLLFASVSHDLKSSLNAILGFADIIDTQRIAPQQAESLQVIKTRGRELLGLIQTILDGARVEAGQVVLLKRKAVIHDLLRDAVEQTREAFSEDAVPIFNEATYAPWEVFVDPDRIVDAIRALLRHAIRTTTSGAIHLRAVVSPSGREVLIDINVPSRTIPAAKLSRLLLPDGESTMPRSAGGLALGLSLARSLVVLHGGNVEPLDTVSGVVLRVALPLDVDWTAQEDADAGA